jgi:hypothetical protein
MSKLSSAEKMALTAALRSAFARGTSSFAQVLASTTPLAMEEVPNLADEAASYLAWAKHVYGESDPELGRRIDAYGDKLYAPVGRTLGWTIDPRESEETTRRRVSVLRFLAFVARNKNVRAEALKRGRAVVGIANDGKRHPDAVDSDLRRIALGVLGEEADASTFDALLALLKDSEDSRLRAAILVAMGCARRPELASRARDLSLDPRLHATETMVVLRTQLGHPATREDAWRWLKDHFDALTRRVGAQFGVAIVSAASSFCDEAHAADAEAFFAPYAGVVEGLPRALASTVEGVRACATRRAMHEASARSVFR